MVPPLVVIVARCMSMHWALSSWTLLSLLWHFLIETQVLNLNFVTSY